MTMSNTEIAALTSRLLRNSGATVNSNTADASLAGNRTHATGFGRTTVRRRGKVMRFVAALADDTGETVGKAVFTTIMHVDGTYAEILRVRVAGIHAHATLSVWVDGDVIGTISTDSNGNGLLILSSNPQTLNVGQLPEGSSVTPATTITLGTSITGTFSTPAVQPSIPMTFSRPCASMAG